MVFEVPTSVQEYLASVDAAQTPLPDYLSPPLTLTPGIELTAPQRKGAFAEIEIWRFSRPNLFERRSPWGIYWSETSSFTTNDGKRVLLPDADQVDAETVAYWISRAGEARHPVLRSRYADVAWEIGRYLRKRGKSINDPALAAIQVPVSVAHSAIDAYLESVERRLAKDYMEGWQYLNRATELAKAVNDTARLARCRTAVMALRDELRSIDRHAGQTWRFYEIVAKHFAYGLDTSEKAQILADLKAELAIVSDISNPQTFDPHAATDIAERLQRWGQMSGDATVGPEAVRVAGAAFEQAAAMAGGLVAVSWLEDLLSRYRAIGDAAGAARVEETIRQRANDARSEMNTHSVTVEVPRKEFDEFAEQVCGQSLDQALTRVVGAVLMKYDSMVEQVKRTLEGAPLFSMITMSLTGPEGFTEAKVGGIEEDEEGRAIHYAGQMMSMQGGMLDILFERILQKYTPTAAQIADFIELCPFFGHDHRSLLERSLQAWLDRDSVVAAHLLVPQLEAALRALCRKAGGSVMTPDDRLGGFRVNGMGAVLNEDHLAAVMPRDVRFHLVALLTDPRGLSARNHIAHGMALPESLGMGLCNWIVHAVLTVALFRSQNASESSSTTQTGS